MGAPSSADSSLLQLDTITTMQFDTLGAVLGSTEKAKESMIYSYNRYFNGFAAVLEENEVAEIANNPNVLIVFENKGRDLHTTHSWEFMGLENNGEQLPADSAWKLARNGEDTIIGNLDIGTKNFEDMLYSEMRGGIKEDNDISIPQRKGPYYYYTKNLEGNGYVQHCRRRIPDTEAGVPPSANDTMPTGLDAPLEHVILDKNVKSQGHENYRLGAYKVSPNDKLVAYSEGTKGNEIYTVYVIDAETGAPVGNPIAGTSWNGIKWASDEALVYITRDEIQRPYKAWLHKLGIQQSSDSCLYHEKDDAFTIGVQALESGKFLFVYSITSVNSEVIACPVNNTSSTTVVLPHRESVSIEGVTVFKDHLVALECEKGQQKVTIYGLLDVGEPVKRLEDGRTVDFVDPIYSVSVDFYGSQFSSNILRLRYGSFKTPLSVIDYDLETCISDLKKIDIVLWCLMHQVGTQIPISIVYLEGSCQT